MHLPSFMWLWRIAAWSMGLTVTLFFGLAVVGLMLRRQRLQPGAKPQKWLRILHRGMGLTLVLLIVNLLAIGVVGTLGYYGSLGHSWHLPVGLIVVVLALGSAWSATRIHPQRPWARSLHLKINSVLFVALALVSLSGWSVVQKYIPQ
ncbi:MAG: DUF4079 domain-containing protein [Thermosynechococcaceae cyanobacterium]